MADPEGLQCQTPCYARPGRFRDDGLAAAKTVFQNTCKALLSTIVPIVIAWRTQRGKVEWGIGAGMFVNEEGWLVTAAHILNQARKLDQAARSTRLRKRPRGNDITNFCFLVGQDVSSNITAHINDGLDIGVAKLKGVEVPPDYTFPKFRVRDVEQGELLCRAGYPFVNEGRNIVWSAEAGFELKGVFPVPMFVNEALVSRFLNMQDMHDIHGSSAGIWIETSSPGLKGQSGGPLADADGYICGIQVNTAHYPLGFQGKGRNQVLHVGRAAHCESIRMFLDRQKVRYYTERMDV